jgi:hypothetical protein
LRWLIDAMGEGSPDLFAHTYSQGDVGLQLKLAGWKRYAELKQVQKESRMAFIAMKFGDVELDHAVDHCFRPAVRRTARLIQIKPKDLALRAKGWHW